MDEKRDVYICLAEAAEHEIVVKKSRFICTLVPVESEADAQQALLTIKKKYHDARHNCSAWVIGAEGNMKKSSDDGEPQGTAGIPMLEVLERSGITNVLAVVTRYFGGVLLGAGGLVRAYSASVAQTLVSAKKQRRIPAVILRFQIDYADYSKLQSIASEYDAKVEAEFTEKVDARIVFRLSDYNAVEKRVSEAFLGADVYEQVGNCYITELVVNK